MSSDLTEIGSIIRESQLWAQHRISPDEHGEPGVTSAPLPLSMDVTGSRGASRAREKLLSLAQAMSSESALEAGALGFMAKFLVQTTLPHRDQPGNQYLRTDGNLTLRISDIGGAGLPYGSYPRLILIWMNTEAVRTSNRELELGSSLSSFMSQLGLQATGGHWGTIPRFRDQMERLLGAAISTRLSQETDRDDRSVGSNLLLADRFDLWWTPQTLPMPRKSSVTLSANFFKQIVESPVPLDLRAVKALKRSPLALDLYAWATRRVSYLARPTLISWESLRLSFGAGYADTAQGRSRFRGRAIDALHRVAAVYPRLRIESQETGLLLRPSCTHVPKISR